MSSHAGRGEKPLHVRVAEALGIVVRHIQPQPECSGCGRRAIPGRWEVARWSEDSDPEYFDNEVPAYDTDWKAGGPLLERFRIDMAPIDFGTTKPFWCAMRGLPVGDPEKWTRVAKGTGDTALLAVCDLILTLHASGDLLPAHPSKQGDEE